MSAVEILFAVLMLVIGGLGTLAVWLLSDIRDTLRQQIKSVQDIDKRVVRLEALAREAGA